MLTHRIEAPVRRALPWVLFCVGPLSLYASRSILLVLFVLALLALLCRLCMRGSAVADDSPSFFTAVAETTSHRLAAGAVIALIVVAGASALWSQAPQQSLNLWWRVALIVGSGAVVVYGMRRFPVALKRACLDAASYGFALLLLLMMWEFALDGRTGSALKGHSPPSLLFSSHAIALLCVTAWPLANWIGQRGRHRALLFMVFVAIAAALLPLAAAVLALALGALAWLLVTLLGQRAIWVMLMTLWVLVLSAPLTLSASSQFAQRGEVFESHSSWRHRLVIWQFFAERIVDRPVLGYGLGSAHRSGDDPGALAHYVRLAARVGGDAFAAQPPLHPHNSVLQLWHDVGVLGVVSVLLFITALVRAASRMPRSQCALVAGSITSWLVIASVSFGLWQKWWLAGTCISLALCCSAFRCASESPTLSASPAPAHA